ncbi:n-alkane-inducible cytochrome P450 protein [Rutstroemia sp. NJR-2017a WRK4]|nr:n-alkane-inducible cytochrome P450 protein [Rutstroemia sp. NJR-2017a WRK4]
MAFHSIFDLGYLLLLFLSTLLLLTISIIRSHLRSYSLRKGCRPPPSIPHKGPFLGLGIIYGRFPETYEKRSRDTVARDLFAKYGYVFQSFPYGVAEIVTEIPEHVKAIYGTDFESWGTPAAAAEFLNSYNYALRGVGMRMALPFWDFLSRDPKFWSSCKDAQAFVGGILDKVMDTAATASEEQKYSVAYGLASLGQDQVQIRDELLGLFLPFHDAITPTLTNMSFNLARSPQIWTKLHKEISSIGSASITLKLVKGLKYLHAVINETMRLYHGISTNQRIALRDTVLPTGGGPDSTAPIFVKKGVKVVIWFATMARRKNLWVDYAEIWRHERWDGMRISNPIVGKVSVGAGPRMCPASDLGVTQIVITTIRILQQFKTIENRDPVEGFIDRWRVTTVSKNGAKVGLSL